MQIPKTLAFTTFLLTLVIASPVSALVTINSSVSGQTFSDDVDLVTGGQVNGNLGLNGSGHTVNVLDGLISGDLGVLNGFGHTANISGGTIGNDIFLNGGDHVVNISGGMFGGDFFTNGFDTIVNITGFDLSITGDFASSGATITGFLSDGSPINNFFRSNGGGHELNIINVATTPEPGTLGLLGIGLVGLAFVRCKQT